METSPKIYIIESLNFKNESNKRYGGKLISEILTLGKIENQYVYIRTRKELKRVLKIFQELKYRYLFMYCHANENTIGLTLDSIDFKEFGEIVNPYLNRKRLFLSSCLAVNDNFRNKALVNSNCLSVVGPDFNIGFHEAAIIWSAFFYLCYKEDKTGMKHNTIENILSKIYVTFGKRMNGYKRLVSGDYTKMKMNNPKLQEIHDKLTAFF